MATKLCLFVLGERTGTNIVGILLPELLNGWDAGVTRTSTVLDGKHNLYQKMRIRIDEKFGGFGGLYYNYQIKIHQNFLLAYNVYGDPVLNRQI